MIPWTAQSSVRLNGLARISGRRNFHGLTVTIPSMGEFSPPIGTTRVCPNGMIASIRASALLVPTNSEPTDGGLRFVISEICMIP